ncbi:hypothetical protein BJV82DRAFT_583280 [Fennellomyces sp. T-0311]|nr:hypothetical protein BJV82DRAFT_583280 [Fennellomyces sp. T-0311]
MATLIGTMQAIVETNDTNLLFRSGLFGTRPEGGKDAGIPHVYEAVKDHTYLPTNPMDELAPGKHGCCGCIGVAQGTNENTIKMETLGIQERRGGSQWLLSLEYYQKRKIKVSGKWLARWWEDQLGSKHYAPYLFV